MLTSRESLIRKARLKREKGRREAEGSLASFARQAWKIVEPARDYGHNWHIDCIADHLEAVTERDIRNLIINVPPRHMKSLLVSVFWPAWAWGPRKMPSECWLFGSYSSKLATRDSVKARRIIEHPWFIENWGRQFFDSKEKWELATSLLRVDQNQKMRYENLRAGTRISTTPGGTGTGDGGDVIVCLPSDEIIHTEFGKMPIGKIVNERLKIKVWSYNIENKSYELKPIQGWHKNPRRDIYEVGFNDGSRIKCTADHKIYTENRGWVEAQNLSDSDIIPSGGFLSFKPITRLNKILSNRIPITTRPNILNSSNTYSVFFRELFSRIITFGYFNCLSAVQFGSGAFFEQRECPMSFRISNVLGSSAIGQILKDTIQRISIKVSDLLPFWHRPSKGIHHKLVDTPIGNTIPRKGNSGIAFNNSGRQHFPFPFHFMASSNCNSILTSYAALVRNIVNTLKSNDRKPSFIRKIRHNQPTFCISVLGNMNFLASKQGIVVSNCDDPHKVKGIESTVQREGVLGWWDDEMSSRAMEPKRVCKLIIMQRVHDQDLCGHVLTNQEELWEHLCMPFEYEAKLSVDMKGTQIFDPKKDDPREKEGELLWKDRYGEAERDSLKGPMTPYQRSGQLQQRPTPKEGTIFKRHWFEKSRRWNHENLPSEFNHILDCWDLTFKGKKGQPSDNKLAYNVGWKLALKKPDIYVIGQFRKQMGIIGQKKHIPEFRHTDERTREIIIERAANGEATADLLKTKVPGVILVTPVGSKEDRADAVTWLFEAGNIIFPENEICPWVEEAIEEIISFGPKAKYKDRVDSIVHGLERLQKKMRGVGFNLSEHHKLSGWTVGS